MSRNLPTPLSEAIEAPVLRPFLAIRIELPDPVYVWTGIGTLVFDDSDGNEREWIGTGDVGSIDTIGESTDGSATGIKATLNSVPAELAPDVDAQAVRGVKFEVYIGSLNEAFQTVEAVKLLWKGRVSEYRVTDGGDNLTVEVTGESRAIDQRRPSVRRFTDEWQKRRSSSDRFFEYLPRMAEVQVIWGASEQSAPSGGGGGGGNRRNLTDRNVQV